MRSSRGVTALLSVTTLVGVAGVFAYGCSSAPATDCADNFDCTVTPDASSPDVATGDGAVKADGGHPDGAHPDGGEDATGEEGGAGEAGVDAPVDSPADTYVADTFVCQTDADPSAAGCTVNESE